FRGRRQCGSTCACDHPLELNCRRKHGLAHCYDDAMTEGLNKFKRGLEHSSTYYFAFEAKRCNEVADGFFVPLRFAHEVQNGFESLCLRQCKNRLQIQHSFTSSHDHAVSAVAKVQCSEEFLDAEYYRCYHDAEVKRGFALSYSRPRWCSCRRSKNGFAC